MKSPERSLQFRENKKRLQRKSGDNNMESAEISTPKILKYLHEEY